MHYWPIWLEGVLSALTPYIMISLFKTVVVIVHSRLELAPFVVSVNLEGQDFSVRVFLPVDYCSVSANELHLPEFEIRVSIPYANYCLAKWQGLLRRPWLTYEMLPPLNTPLHPDTVTAIRFRTAYWAYILFAASIHIWRSFPYLPPVDAPDG